ncbi:hypothetical protein BaRGS_00017197, partial [Batillaria attramentaria]
NGVEGLCLVALYFTTDWITAISVISTGVAAGGLGMADLAPQYAGVIAGVTMMGGTGAVVSSVMASQLTGISRSLFDWQTLFLVSGIVHLVGVLVFDIIAEAELQPWADNSITHTPTAQVTNGEDPAGPCDSSDETTKLLESQNSVEIRVDEGSVNHKE